VARGNRRKTGAEEMYLSMDVVPDRRTARSSRTASRSALGAIEMCGPLRRDSQAGTSRGRDRHESGSMIHEDHPPQSPRRRETAGCSNIHLRVDGGRGTETTFRGREAGTSSRTNETRVLEIEAVDGRNRSHASRERDMRRSNASCETCALVIPLRGQPPDAARGQMV
jgi:hypothetical protein